VVHASTFTSLVSLQIYFTEKSELGGRIDASGTTSLQTGLILATGLAVGLPLQVIGAAPVCTGSGVAARCDANPLGTAGLLAVVAGALAELGFSLYMMATGGPDGYWARSFDQAIRTGMEPFFDRYAPGGGGAPAPPAVPAYQPPPPPGGYTPPR
jgi:hypothetical protein